MTPDGSTLIYEVVLENGFGIYALRLSDRRTTALSLQNKPVWEQQDNWDYSPVVSPDGLRIAYLHDDPSGTSVRVMPISGDEDDTQIIRLGPGSEGDPAWRDSNTVIATQPNKEIAEFRLAPDGTFTRKRLATLDSSFHAYGLFVLPDGRILVRAAVEGTQLRDWKLFLIAPGSDKPVALAGPSSLRFKGQFLSASKQALYLVTGYAKQNASLATFPIDGGAATTIAQLPVTYGMDIMPNRGGVVWSDCYEYAVLMRLQKGLAPEELTPRWPDVQLSALSRAPDGQISVTSLGADSASVKWLDPAKLTVTDSTLGNASQYVPSSNGQRAVLARHVGAKVQGLFVRKLSDGGERAITKSALDHSPAWSPDGGTIYFLRGGSTDEGATLMRVSSRGGAAENVGFEPMTAFALLPNQEIVFAGAKSQVLQRSSLIKRKPRPLVDAGGKGVFHDLKLAADQRRVLMLRGGKEVLEHVLGTQDIELVADSGEIGLRAIDYAPDGRGVIAAARVWDGDLWLSKGAVP